MVSIFKRESALLLLNSLGQVHCPLPSGINNLSSCSCLLSDEVALSRSLTQVPQLSLDHAPAYSLLRQRPNNSTIKIMGSSKIPRETHR